MAHPIFAKFQYFDISQCQNPVRLRTVTTTTSLYNRCPVNKYVRSVGAKAAAQYGIHKGRDRSNPEDGLSKTVVADSPATRMGQLYPRELNPAYDRVRGRERVVR